MHDYQNQLLNMKWNKNKFRGTKVVRQQFLPIGTKSGRRLPTVLNIDSSTNDQRSPSELGHLSI